jgi:spermidine/putrescine transport system ATP-binding protein
MMKTTGTLELVNVNKYYGDVQILKDFNFSIKLGEFLSLLGPSGCGKTTIIRLIAGLENLQSGEIYLDGRRIDKLPPYKRPVNTIFQNYALFPHMNVFDNIAYGLRAKGSKNIKQKVLEVLELVQLNGFEKRHTNEMSGGQKQRVSIARAIVNNPPVLLLDEPLTALDSKLRKEMRYELRSLQKKLGITFVYVTHDQEEAMTMSDRIAVMNGGRIEQEANPRDLANLPGSKFAAEFIGDNNIFEGQIREIRENNFLAIAFESGMAAALNQDFQKDESINVYIKPDKIKWSLSPVENFRLPGQVTEKILSGSFVQAVVQLVNSKEIRITHLAGRDLPEKGQKVYLSWDLKDAIVMHSQNQNVLTAVNTFDITQWKQT